MARYSSIQLIELEQYVTHTSGAGYFLNTPLQVFPREGVWTNSVPVYLGDDCQLSPQVMEPQLSDVNAIDDDPSTGGFNYAEEG